MKKILFLILIISQVLLLKAQSLTVNGDQSIFTSDPCLTSESYLTVKNISNTVKHVLCEKQVITPLFGAEDYFCWAGNCYSSTTFISPDSLVLQAGEADATSFSGYFDAFCAPGPATIEYCFYPMNDVSDRSCIMITYNAVATNILDSNTGFNLGEFYPNPAKEYAYINYQLQEGSHLNIIDVLGNKVKDFYLSEKGTQKIYVGDLSKGIYFGNVIYNDKIIAIKKLIVK